MSSGRVVYPENSIFPKLYIFVWDNVIHILSIMIVMSYKLKKFEIYQLDDVIGNYATKMHR